MYSDVRHLSPRYSSMVLALQRGVCTIAWDAAPSELTSAFRPRSAASSCPAATSQKIVAVPEAFAAMKGATCSFADALSLQKVSSKTTTERLGTSSLQTRMFV